jgi:hypothetical protein
MKKHNSRYTTDDYRWKKILWMYHLTRAQFEALLKKQGGRCAICRTKRPGGRYNRWVIDHDHKCCDGPYSCGKCVRGLLCNRCNHGLGNFADNQKALQRAVIYLERIEHE